VQVHIAVVVALATAFVACASPGTTARGPAASDPSPSPTEREPSREGASAGAVGSSRCDKANPDELVNGVGACKVDADCVLSSYQKGCCTQACAPSAKSKRDLARAQGAEDCAAMNKQPHCPAPAACQPPTYEPVAAVCCAGGCMTVRRLLP
jgi:hypothetical protein